MPSVGVTKSNALSNSLNANYQHTNSKGFLASFPGFLDGENITNLSYTYDRLLEAFNYYANQRLDKRHIASVSIESMNAKELNDRLDYIGMPYIFREHGDSKKRRSIDWWSKDRGNGDEGTLKSTIYNHIGSGVFYAYDNAIGQADFGKTNRISFDLPANGSTWGDYPSIQSAEWSQVGSTPTDKWTSFNDLGKTELDIKIKYRYLPDYYYWKQDVKKADLYYLINKVKPLGLLYTITDVFDGALNDLSILTMWLELDRAVSDKTGTYTPSSNNITFQSGLGKNTARFNGSNSHITQTSTALTASGSIFGWLYVDEENGDQYMFSYDNNDNYIFHQSGTGIVYKVEGGTEQTYSGTPGYADGVWNFVGMTWDGTDFEYIYNDSVVASGTDNGLTTTSATLVLGKRHDDTNYLQGNIRNFRIYNKKLSNSEWLELYSGISQFV